MVPVRGGVLLDHGLFRGWAGKVSPGSISYFSFSLLFLFCFLDYFIIFSNLIQIDSNKLCKVYKIPSNNSEQ
jgi:hypothetical protein